MIAGLVASLFGTYMYINVPEGFDPKFVTWVRLALFTRGFAAAKEEMRARNDTRAVKRPILTVGNTGRQ